MTHHETRGDGPMGGGSMSHAAMGHAAMGGAPMSEQMQQCIDNCMACHAICLSTSRYCLTMGGAHVEASHMGRMMDCAEICQTSANFMLRNSPLHHATCGVCADACEACAVSCEQFADDAQMQLCAETCRRCAASCREMAM